ncbi:MAG: hypothetical protein NVS2B14_12910 [Chamaesiphon sp.]
MAVVLLLNASLLAQEAKAVPIFQNVTIKHNFSPNPTTIRGISGGSVPGAKIAGQAQTTTGPCMGYMNEKPDHTVVLTSFFKNLSIIVESSEDTTMVIEGPGGIWCNDDYQGKNPGFVGQWLAGSYKIWVGSYKENKYSPYIIQITEKR